MLDLAIRIVTDSRNTAIIETHRGATLKAPGWPQDCGFQLVASNLRSDVCDIVSTESLAEDLGNALLALDKAAAFDRQEAGSVSPTEKLCSGNVASS